MLDIEAISKLHRETILRWHQQAIDQPYEGFLGLVCRQCGFNFLLWHEEDIARSPTVSDGEIAQVKRAIDRYNQQRNDAIEKLDDWITEDLIAKKVQSPAHAPLNTETLGSVIDRLSILALRIYHLEEQLQRSDASEEHLAGVRRKLAVAQLQQTDLTQAFRELASDIYAGRKRHKTYRQLKMYNDPTLNPYLYGAKSSD